MCGISGMFGRADGDAVRAMMAAMVHRGPDDEGIFVDPAGRVALGHNRLAILDLSAAGHQPMSYRDRYFIVFNGEIYNYRELRAQLQARGHVFRSATDTEVLLAAYAEWGEACLERLRGMFAFAIYDRRAAAGQASLFLARDRFGIKPLCYARREGVLVFASELKGLLASGLVARRADPQAIWDYLSLGSVPEPATILKDARRLPAGHAMAIDARGESRLWRYWDIAAAPATIYRGTKAEAAAELRRLLDEATRLHMIADVPVGAFLSGGVDSSAVVGLMSRHVAKPLKTYSIAFESPNAPRSELSWARLAAERFHTDHTEAVITMDDIAREYEPLLQALDQPSVDGTNSYLVSKVARQGVTVALSGLGGDELLAGYPHFQWMAAAARWDRFGRRYGRWSRRIALRLAGRGGLPDRRIAELSMPMRHAMIRCFADEERKRAITGEALAARTLRPLADFYAPLLRENLDPIAQMSYVEIRGYMLHTLLRDLDAVSMAHSLEVRPVLLDHALASFIFRLPGDYKLDGARAKAVMADVVRDLLPTPIIERPKLGFEVPFRDWLAGPLRETARAAFASPTARTIFKPDFLEDATRGVDSPGREDRRLWSCMILIEWLARNGCEIADGGDGDG